MSDCHAVVERMPLLLTEALDSSLREATHAHIESCANCTNEWDETRETWRLLAELPEVPLPQRARARFMSHVDSLAGTNVVPFSRRFPVRPFAQAAAVAILVGSSFFAGRQFATSPSGPDPLLSRNATDVVSSSPILPASYPLAESLVLPASAVNPELEGRPNIKNVRFEEGAGSEIGVSFDITSHMTITGRPGDKSLVKLVSYLLQNQENSTHSRSRTIQWVKDTWEGQSNADPEIVRALANVLKNDTHEGVRIKAVEALSSMPDSLASEARSALVEALKSDPNPAVRIKAIDALTHSAAGTVLDPATVDMLRQKATQNDENVYVRVKAAEALGQINL